MPELIKLLPSKQVVIQVHSPRASLKNIGKTLKDPTIDVRLVVAQFQARQFPECTVVPNAVNIEEKPYVNLKRNNDLPHIVYSPSNTALKGWSNKGHSAVSKALKSMRHFATTDIITNTPHIECVTRKQRGDIAIDEFMTGSYHLCTLEGLSHGQAVFCHLDELTKKAVAKITSDPLPVIDTSEKNFSKDLWDLLKDRNLINKMGENARAFMEKNWSPKEINEKYEKAYRS
jgi:hypothetical protein